MLTSVFGPMHLQNFQLKILLVIFSSDAYQESLINKSFAKLFAWIVAIFH